MVTYKNIVILKYVATPINTRENEASVCISVEKSPQILSTRIALKFSGERSNVTHIKLTIDIAS